MELLFNVPAAVVVCIDDFWCRSFGTFKTGHQSSGHACIAPLRLGCHHHCHQKLAPLVQHAGDVLHGALAITVDLLENL